MNFLSKHKITIAGSVAGAILGYLYYHFTGCENGNCMITSKPINSILYGALLGGLLTNIFNKEKSKESSK